MTKYIVIVLEHTEDGVNVETTHKLFDTYEDAEQEIKECVQCYDDGEWIIDNKESMAVNKENDQKWLAFTVDKVEL